MPIQEGGTFSPDSHVVSPGVFTRENDLSGVASGVADIGGVVVAPFAQGPAFSPTLLTDVNTLQSKFGAPDGIYYGPYTAAQYLQQQGLVTVCRVGPLTGYWQRYPFHIYAVKGYYTRNGSAGTLNSGSSFVYFSGSVNNPTYSYAESITFTGQVTSSAVSKSVSGDGTNNIVSSSFSSSFYSSSFTITNASLTLKFAPLSADNTTLNVNGTNTQSGSLLYAGQTITVGTIALIVASSSYYGLTATSSSVTSQSYSASVTTSFVTNYLTYGINSSSFSSSIAAGTFAATIVNPDLFNIISGSQPFANSILNNIPDIDLFTGSIFTNLSTCGFPVFNMGGVLSGSFGTYNGFVSNAPTFNPCVLPNGQWTTGSGNEVRLLAVLADTMAGGIENLQTPGFASSSLLFASGSGITTGLIYPSIGVSAIPTDYSLFLYNSLNSTSPYGVYNFSLDSSNPHFITNVFGNSATAGNPAKQVAGQKIEAAYLYKIYEDTIDDVVDNITNWGIFGAAFPSGSGVNAWSGEPMNFTDQYSLNPLEGDSQFAITNAFTPWILSQKIAPWQPGGSPTRFELFRFATLSDGTNTNTSYKVEISNVRLAGQVAGSNYGSFTVTLRQYSDTDKKPIILEQYNNVNLDPDSANFIARRIGDQYNYINFSGKIVTFGIYSNNSQYVRVEMTQNNYPETAIPYGFEAYSVPTNGAMGVWTPTMKYTKASIYGLAPGKYPSGVNFGDAPVGADAELQTLYPTLFDGSVGTSADNLQYFAPLPSFNTNGQVYSSIGRNVEFALDDPYYGKYNMGTGSYLAADLSGSIPTIYDPVNETTYVKMRRFVFGFQGGFDGQAPSIPINVGGDITAGNTQGLDCTTVSSPGSVAYAQCIGALSNADQYDINLIVAPGIVSSEHPYVTNMIVDMCEQRGDVFYIMDLYVDSGNPTTSQIEEVVSEAALYDTNYAASYYPWVRILDTYNNQVVTVPPSVVLPAVYASNDKVAAEWFAPAGLNRGGITTATGVTDRTTHQERDTLYEGKVNPIATFPGAGVVVWGQKTLQNADSALNRINVRRLLINIKKFFASTSKYLVFEQNVAATRNKFLSIVNPYMESIQQRSGLYAFYVQMDDKNNTPDIIDQNILYGQIYLKPTKTAEFIVLDFNILPTGASFATA